MGYAFTYPYVLPPGPGGVPAVALDSKGNLWAFQRADAGKPQLFKFDPNHKLILQVGPDVIGYQDKAHGMAVDAEDNVWITAATSATVMKISPEGKLLLTIGTPGRRGDWDEAKGQRLLWQPVMVAFARNGDVYIGEGHANESPNDTDSEDSANTSGAARIIHLDKNGKFINQWFSVEDLLRLMQDRRFRRVTVYDCLVYARPGESLVSFCGSYQGHLATEPGQSTGTPIERLFIPTGYDTPISEFSHHQQILYWSNAEIWRAFKRHLETNPVNPLLAGYQQPDS